ncbi:DUF4190 domain-containing protein [Thalassobacillus hwangdonensis]|uniref:DUF4190 domain-containing protein n=1 Tax=Thalassobacillus hwangdonensis TaxID=546108 RepID=A0ABW3L5B0_9BACI
METKHEQQTAPEQVNGLAIASMVLGIVGLVLVIIPIIPYILAILAVVFGFISMNRSVKKGFSITGVVTGFITLGLKILFWVLVFGFANSGY